MERIITAIFAVAMHVSCIAAPSAEFPAAAVSFVDTELIQMEPAVRDKDQTFFAASKSRMERFLTNWGHNSPGSTTLDRFPMCTEAVTDYLIVGLCRISPPNTICDPTTFIPKFEDNLAKCRTAAKANSAIDPDGSAAGHLERWAS